MNRPEQAILDDLTALASKVAARSYAPYSGEESGCVVLLSNGDWAPGVRVENASFPLLIPAAMNAITTACAAGRTDFVAAVSNRPFGGADQDYLQAFLPDASFNGCIATSSRELTPVAKRIDPYFSVNGADPDLTSAAREVATRALVDESDFRVGCILETESGGLIPGCNVEHADWNLTLCAERNAIGTAVTYGQYPWRQLYVSCIEDPTGSPCGACRQVLVEHAPNMLIVMDRGRAASPEKRTGADLLPSYFGGSAVRKKQK